MRVDDRPLPPVTLDPVTNIDTWPVRPVIAIQQRPVPPYVWDTAFATWDDPTPLVWDPGSTLPDWVDATCEWQGLELETGAPDDHGMFPAGRLTVQLDNRTGQWSQYNVDGSPSNFGPGQIVHVWAHNPSGDWWLFSGSIARWDERSDDTVELEAFDVFSDLAQPVGTFTVGVAGDRPGQRAPLVMAAAGRASARANFAVGTVGLSVQSTEKTPLEELQTVVASDGGIVFADADGTVRSTDRTWRTGRTDQTSIPAVSDNVCTAPVIVWDAVLSTNDDGLADTVVLENVAKLRAQTPATVSGFVYTATEQQWQTQGEGDTLAAFMLAAQNQPRVAVESFDLYLLDPLQPDLWQAVDWRLGDRLRFVHDFRVAGGMSRVDVTAVVAELNHSITPDAWVVTVGTTRAVDYTTPILWDTPIYRWDDADALWGY